MKWYTKAKRIVVGWIHLKLNRHEAEPLIGLEWACRCGMPVDYRIHGGSRPYVETPTYRNF